MASAVDTASAQGAGTVSFGFTGQPGEYFRIWIVNLCLSVLTLGIYSAWAKVRRKRYFYGNTLLAGSGFEYLADPKTILKGRIIVFAAFLAYMFLKELHPLVLLALIIAFLIVLPWVVLRALQFNARNSAYRSVRFGFTSQYLDVAGILALSIFLVPLTLGLAYPYYLYRKRRFFLERSAYGTTRFGFAASAGEYYSAALKVLLAFVAFLAASIATLGIGLVPFYILLRAYAETLFARLDWRKARLGEIHFDCGWTTGGLFKLYALNSLAIIVSLGLLVPWAAIRTARYKLERISLHSARALDSFVASAQQAVEAVGDEAGELLGFDFGL
jgi:uncharacterized membrane protein YjgN (DUF898 family)